MFIKKDRRRIEEILQDPHDDRKSLNLTKRVAEFLGSIRPLTKEINSDAFVNLKVLNLYDNALTSIAGIQFLTNTPIEEINLGCNQLTELPLEFGMIKTLKSVWLDDNEFETFPNALCALPQLQCIRMSKNSLKEVPESISTITSLEILALDNNAIDVVSAGVYRLSALKQLWLRQNRIAELPAGIDGLRALEVLSLSSNLLTSITEELVKLPSLKKLYLNGNRIEKIPAALLLALSSTSLQVLNIANNFIETLPEEWYEQVNGSVSKVADIKIGSITVTIVGNPLQRP